MNGAHILGTELRDIRDSVKDLDGPEILHELKGIKYIIEGLEGNYDGFVLKEKADSAGHRESVEISPENSAQGCTLHSLFTIGSGQPIKLSVRYTQVLMSRTQLRYRLIQPE